VARVAAELRENPDTLKYVLWLLRILREGGDRRRAGIESNIENFIDSMEKEAQETRARGDPDRPRPAEREEQVG